MEEEERYKKAFFYGSVLPFAILVIVGVTEIVMKQTDFPWIMEFVLCFLAMLFYLVIEKAYIKPEWGFVWALVAASLFYLFDCDDGKQSKEDRKGRTKKCRR